MSNVFIDVKFSCFVANYSVLHPTEIAPTTKILEIITNEYPEAELLLSGMNMIYYVNRNEYVEIVAHWCMASSKLPRDKNMKAFFEVLRWVDSFKKPVVISGLNTAYYKVTEPFDTGRRKFK